MYTKNDITQQLNKMNAPQNAAVAIHISLRLVGQVEGGAKTLLDAFIEYFTKDGGLLCIPAHTWANIGKDCPTLDMQNPKSNLGAFPNIAMQDGRGVLTQNPTHAMVVFGQKEKVLDFIESEKTLETPTAPQSCCARLDYVLLVGVAHDKNTYLHAVGEMLSLENRMSDTPFEVTVKKQSGEIVSMPFRIYESDFTDDISLFFPKYETAFRYHRCITDGFVGKAPTQLCDCKKMKDTIQLIFERADGNDPLKSIKPIPPKYYC